MFSWCSQSDRARRGLTWLLAGLMACSQAVWGQPSPFKPYEHRALYLYNFAKFTNWPESAFAAQDSPFVIGILGEDPFQADAAIIEGKPMKGRKVEVKRFRTLAQIRPCHLLFIAKSEQQHLSEILEQVKKKPVLTVAEIDNFIANGGMVNLFLSEKNTLSFDVNLAAAEQAGLKLDTRFLRLARQVKTE